MKPQMISPEAMNMAVFAELQVEIQMNDDLLSALKQAREMILALNSGMHLSEGMKQIDSVIKKMEKRK